MLRADPQLPRGEKWVPSMQSRSHLGIYRIGCRAYLMAPGPSVFLPLAPAACMLHFKTSTSVHLHHHLHHHHLINVFQSTSTKYHSARETKGK